MDGLSDVEQMVAMADKFGQPAVALTDHGVMSGAVQLYKHARKAGVEPIVGIEAYLVNDVNDKDAQRYHLTLLARDFDGYQTLVRLSSLSHQRDRYHRKPRLSLMDFVDQDTSHLTVLTGCYGGPVTQALVHDGEARAKRLLQQMSGLFPHLYVELQDHHATRDTDLSDAEVSMALYDMAGRLGLDVAVTQDSHYCAAKHRPVHDLFKRMVIRGVPEDAAFHGDSFHFCSPSWMEKRWDPRVWASNESGVADIVAGTNLRIPALETYRYYIPEIIPKPYRVLSDKCNVALLERTAGLPAKRQSDYTTRLAHELAIIKATGFANYFILVADYVEWAMVSGYLVNARGSVNGSLVAWLLGITHVDPIKWGLLFERFIDRNRKSPPDIDLDIEDTGRDAVIGYLSTKLDVVQIGTFSTLGLTDDETGSLFVKYLAWAKAVMEPVDFDTMFGDRQGRSLASIISDASPDDYDRLVQLDRMKAKGAPGSHAAGFVLSTKAHPISSLIPTMLIPSSGTIVTQYTMDDVEALGFVKSDMLGQRTLRALRDCMESIGKYDSRHPFDWIPLDDSRACKLLSTGVPDSAIFTAEGYSTAKGIQRLGIKKTKDCITAVSLFRPATMEAGFVDAYFHNRSNPSLVWYPHPIFERYLKETHGIVVYQEQVLEILRELGMPSDDLNAFLKAVKESRDIAKAGTVFEDRYRQYIDLCAVAGVDDPDRAWAMIEGFAAYGFNRAHGTAYGLVMYYAGYLKAHYPVEYMAAMLAANTSTPKEPKYIRECRRLNIRVVQPTVNDAGVMYRAVNGRVVRGLQSIKGVGQSAAKDIVSGAPYVSMEDLLSRTPARTVNGRQNIVRSNGLPKEGELAGVLLRLQDAGALRCIGLEPGDIYTPTAKKKYLRGKK